MNKYEQYKVEFMNDLEAKTTETNQLIIDLRDSINHTTAIIDNNVLEMHHKIDDIVNNVDSIKSRLKDIESAPIIFDDSISKTAVEADKYYKACARALEEINPALHEYYKFFAGREELNNAAKKAEKADRLEKERKAVERKKLFWNELYFNPHAIYNVF